MFAYYTDKAVPIERAKVRVLKESYETSYDLFKQDKDLTDFFLLESLTNTSRFLNKRGLELTKILEEEECDKAQVLRSLQELKRLNEEIKHFTNNYKGDGNV